MQPRIIIVTNTYHSARPDPDHEPEKVIPLIKVHISFSCDQDKSFQLRVGCPSLTTDDGELLKTYDCSAREKEYPLMLVNTPEYYCFFEERQLKNGSLFRICIAELEHVVVERYTFTLDNLKWKNTKIEKTPISNSLRKSLMDRAEREGSLNYCYCQSSRQLSDV